jgi:hypothetical protein
LTPEYQGDKLLTAFGRLNFGPSAMMDSESPSQRQHRARAASVSAETSSIPITRARARSTTINLESNPLETPLTAEEHSLTRLVQAINLENEREKKEEEKAKQASPLPSFEPLCDIALAEFLKAEQVRKQQDDEDADKAEFFRNINRLEARDIAGNMSYQNYLESPVAGPSSNPRQAPPSPSQNMNHANGMNGGAMGIGGMTGFPTPAGHQSDLNYIMTMVEELSRQLEHNQRLTSGVVEKIGKVREKAQNMDLTNDELIALVASEMNGTYLHPSFQNFQST